MTTEELLQFFGATEAEGVYDDYEIEITDENGNKTVTTMGALRAGS